MPSILLAGDDINKESGFETLLKNEGYKILTANDGLAAFNTAFLNHPDLIIADIRMHHLDGFELLMALQLNSNTSIIPLFLILDRMDKDKAQLGFNLGAKECFIKPVQYTDILKSIEKLHRHKAKLNI